MNYIPDSSFIRSCFFRLFFCLGLAAAPVAGAQSEKPVPGELKLKPGKDTATAPEATPTPSGKEAKGSDKEKSKEEERIRHRV